MPDARKPPRGGLGPPPLPQPVKPAPPVSVAPSESVELSLSGAIEISRVDSPSLERPTPDGPEAPPTLPEVSANVAVSPTMSFNPPPPPRPRRLTQPVSPLPPPPPPKPTMPHRVGVDPTLVQPTLVQPTLVQPTLVQPTDALPPSLDEPFPIEATSLFRDNVIEDSAPVVVAIPVWDVEVELLTREVAAVREQEPSRAALLLGAQSTLFLAAKHDRAAALGALEASLALAEERYSLHLSRRVALVDRAFQPALALGRRELGLIVDPRERHALLLHTGVLEHCAGDLAAAQRAFEAARELDPRDDATLLALTDVYAAQRAWDPLASTYHALADGSADPSWRGMFRHAAGTVEERGLEKNDLARSTYRAALLEDPQSLPAVTALSSLALRLEDWSALAHALETEADLLDEPATQRGLYERAGDLYWERLSDAERATTCFRKAALAVPDAPGPLRRLASVLESIGRWNELVDVFFAELPLCNSPEERADLHHLVGEVNENHLERHEDAIVAYQAALAEVPDHVASLQALAGLFARTRRLDAVMQAELGEAERIADPLRRASRYLHLGDVAVHVVGDETEGTRLYERCAELEPGHRAAFQGLESIHRRRRDHAKLADLYERQAKATAARPLARLYLGAAARSLLEADRADERRAGTPDPLARVEQHLRAAQELDTVDVSPLFTLADALEDAGQWERLVTVLEQLGKQLGDDKTEQIGLLHRAARVLELRLGSNGRALAAYEQILAREPAHEAALLAVVRLHQRAGRGPLEIVALGRLRDHASTALEGAALSYRIGRIHERRAGDTEAALLAYEEALARKPDFLPALRALERLLRRDRRWSRLVEIVERQLAAARSSAERADLRHAVGQIEELHLRNLERAEESYTAALREAPGHAPAGAALAQVKHARADHAGLAKLLEEQVSRLEDPAALVASLLRLAALYEGPLDDATRAHAMLAKARDAGSFGARAWAGLLRTSRPQGLSASTAALSSFSDAVREPRLQLGARVLVALREEALPGGESSVAFDELEGRDAVILDGKIRRAIGRASDKSANVEALALARLLDERARLVDVPALRALLHLEAACRYDRCGHPRDAGQALEAADQSVNDLIPVLRGVRRIAIQSEQWPAAVALFAHEAELSRDPQNQADALLQAGELALVRANDPRAALEHFRRLLTRQPLHPIAFQRTGEILERSKDWLAIAALWRQRAEALDTPQARADAWRKKAEVERDRLRDVASALASLRSALDASPDDLESWKAIAPLQEHQRFWQDAIDTYRKIAELSNGDALSRAAKIREADLRERELGDREGARLVLQPLAHHPDDRDAQRRLAGLSERMGQWDEARALWTQLAMTSVPQDRADALVSLGQAVERGTRDEATASAHYDEALALALDSAELLPSVEARFRDARALDAFAEAAERALASSRGEPGELALRDALVRVYVKDLASPERAEAQLVVATELRPDDPATFRALGQLLVDTGRPERALPLLHRAIDLLPSSPETLRAMGAGLGYTGLRDAPRIFESAAAHIAGSAPPSPVSPLPVRRALSVEEWNTYFPRDAAPGVRAMTDLARTLEPYAAQLIAELTGERPRGEPVGGAAEQVARATFAALGVQPLRLYVDPELGPEVLPCADDAVALLLGPSLLEPVQASRLCFEIVRVIGWMAQGETLGAYLRGHTLATFVLAACDERGDDEVKEIRRRVGKALPRKVRKELERFSIPLADAVGLSGAWERSGYAAVEELALLVCRDAGVVFESLGYLPGEPLPSRGRGVELVRFLASEDCWRAYRRLADG